MNTYTYDADGHMLSELEYNSVSGTLVESIGFTYVCRAELWSHSLPN